jgi:hypothetical protein
MNGLITLMLNGDRGSGVAGKKRADRDSAAIEHGGVIGVYVQACPHGLRLELTTKAVGHHAEEPDFE